MEYVVVDKKQLEADLTTVSDSIRGLLETEEKLSFPQGMKEAVESYSLDEPLTTQDALIEQIKTVLQGKASGGEDYFKCLSVAKIGNLNKFAKNEIVLKCDELTTAYQMFQQSVLNTTVEHIVITTVNQMESCGNFFYANIDGNDQTLKKITLNMDFSKCASFTSTFNGLTVLEIIDGTPLDASSVTNFGLFVNKCYALREIRFAPLCINKNISFSHSNLLSSESIQSIIDALVDLTDGTAQTVAFHKDVKAKLTEEQIATITNKNWTVS